MSLKLNVSVVANGITTIFFLLFSIFFDPTKVIYNRINHTHTHHSNAIRTFSNIFQSIIVFFLSLFPHNCGNFMLHESNNNNSATDFALRITILKLNKVVFRSFVFFFVDLCSTHLLLHVCRTILLGDLCFCVCARYVCTFIQHT